MQPDQAVINRWNGAAPFWEKHSETIRQMFAPVTQALVEDALIGKGHTVLDVATGPGEPALTVAALVGPEGKVVGIDPVPGMVAAARRAAERQGRQNTQFEVAFADQLPFPDDTFDTAISRFGVMFFPSPLEGVHEMLRVLKPGGKLTLAAWHLAQGNPFFHAIQQVVDRYVEPPPPDPDAPDGYRFAAPGKLRSVLVQAGVAAPSEHLLQFTIEAPITAEEFWTLRCEMSEKVRNSIATLPAEQGAEVRRQSLETLREYSIDGCMRFPAEVLIVSGSKPVHSTAF